MVDGDGPVRVGIVGCGTIGQIHADRIVELGHEIVGAVDVSESAREGFTETYEVDTYEHHDALYESDVDAVFIATPNAFHEEAAVSALEAGLDVLIEKPLAHTIESAERIAAAARTASGFCMVGFTMRFADVTREVKTLQQEGAFGEVTHVQANYVRQKIPSLDRGWFARKELSGGGALIDIGVHVLDLALHVVEFPEILEVSGTTRTEYGEYDVDDSATAFVRCAGGTTITLEAAWMASCEPTRACVVRGTEGGARFDVTQPDVTRYELTEAGTSYRERQVEVSRNDIHLHEDKVFLDAAAAGHPPTHCTVEEALTVQRVLDAIYESSERGRAVQFD